MKVTLKSTVIDLILTAIVGYLFLVVFKSHVPGEPDMDAGTKFLVALYTALPGAGTFWLCLQMVKVVYVHQKQLEAERAAK